MKALIRNKGETVTEDMNIPCIDWNTGYPLTDPKWFGGPYTLVENYEYEVEQDLDYINEVREQLGVEDDVCDPEEADFIEIDGKRYSKEELRRLIE